MGIYEGINSFLSGFYQNIFFLMMNSKKLHSIMVISKYGESNLITKKCNDIEILYIYRNLRAINPHAVRIKYHRIKSTKFCLMLGICTINTRVFW